MVEVEVLKKIDSKADAFLLPLTGLTKSQKYPMRSYLFWDNYTIEDYQIIVVFEYPNYKEFVSYCKRVVFPILDRNGYLIESYDFEGKTVFVLDISEWALDVEMFLKGRYSKFSVQAKERIESFHTFFDKIESLKIWFAAPLNPNERFTILGGLTAMEYVAEHYGLPLKELQEVGELGSIYDKKAETLVL